MDRRLLLAIAVAVPLAVAAYGMYRISEDCAAADNARRAVDEPHTSPTARLPGAHPSVALLPDGQAREWTLDDEIAARASELNAADHLTHILTALTVMRAHEATSATLGGATVPPQTNRS